jgi:Brp/Blh family beta-carotene 15,15'-monooxygenase
VTELLPQARRTSRAVVLAALASSAVLSRRAPGGRAEQGVVLAALALGMPHGAADTELLRAASRGSRSRHAALLLGYALLAASSTVAVRRGGTGIDRAVLLASAAHFGEGELACWRAAPLGRTRRRNALRLVAAVVTTVGLPAAVGTANRRPAEVGLSAALDGTVITPRAVGERTGWKLLQDARTRRVVGPLMVVAGAATAALAVSGDREAAGDSALLAALALLTPPSTAFASYFGGWHALRHTARVVDALVADGELPAQQSLPHAAVELGRRSAWAAGVGLAGAGALAAAHREHASDDAFAAVLGLTVPHMTTVALQLARRGR